MSNLSLSLRKYILAAAIGTATLAGATMVFVCARPVLAAAVADPTGEEVLDKYIEVTGGKAAYEKVKDRVVTGKMSVPAQGISGDIVMYQKAPNLTYMSINIPQIGVIERGFNGEIGWEKNPMTGTRIVDGEEKEQLLRESTINNELNWRNTYSKVENVGTENIDDKPAYKLVMTTKTGNEETRYYDVKSGLLVQTSMTVKNAQGVFPIVATPSDWREVAGIKMPFKSTQELKSVGMEQIIAMDKVETNTDIPDSKFDLPEDVKELAKQEPTTKPSK
jgi:hypothetical protein